MIRELLFTVHNSRITFHCFFAWKDKNMPLQPPEQNEMDEPEEYYPRLRLDPHDYPDQIPIEKFLEMYPPPEESSPPSASSEPPTEIIQPLPSQEPPAVPSQPIARRGRPPVDKPKPQKKKKGGQPGNLNALKHGLYVQGNAIYNSSPIERAQLYDLNTAVIQYKDYINRTYQNGVKQTDIDKINETMRNLSLAAIALTRLLNAYDHGRTSMLPFDRNARVNRSMQKIVDYYNNQIDSFMGKSDTAPDSAE